MAAYRLVYSGSVPDSPTPCTRIVSARGTSLFKTVTVGLAETLRGEIGVSSRILVLLSVLNCLVFIIFCKNSKLYRKMGDRGDDLLLYRNDCPYDPRRAGSFQFQVNLYQNTI